MQRTLLALCAIVLAGLGFGAAPASAYVGDYDFSNRNERASAAGERRSARSSRSTRAARRVASSDDGATRTTTRRRARANSAMESLTGGGIRSSGIASYYWQPQRVASGGWFNPNAMTAAHKTLPFGTRVRVTNLNNGRSVVVSINDRGPYIAGRVIDLSRAAASAVGMTGAGLARVNLAVLGR